MVKQLITPLTDFLVKVGNLPAYKEQDPVQEEMEESLYNKLRLRFAGIQSAVINELRRMKLLPSNDAERKAFVEGFLEEIFGDMSEAVADQSLEAAIIGRTDVLNQLRRAGRSVSFDMFDEWVADRLRTRHYEFSLDTFRRITGDVAENLARSYERGLGIDEAAKELRKEFSEIRNHRLRLIARTEIQSAQQEGAFETMNELDVQYKQWLTARDSRVRDEHRDLHGVVVRRDERFPNGLMHPGDRAGDIEEWINCRCRMRIYIPRRGEIILSTPYYPAA